MENLRLMNATEKGKIIDKVFEDRVVPVNELDVDVEWLEDKPFFEVRKVKSGDEIVEVVTWANVTDAELHEFLKHKHGSQEMKF